DNTFNGQITVALANNPGGAGAVLGGSTTLTAVSGIARITGLILNTAASNYTLSITSTLPTVTTSPFTVAPAAASQLVITTQPPSTVATSSPFSIVVAAQDSLGNIVTSYTSNVTLAIATGPAGGTLAGTLTVAAVNGVASFSGLSLGTNGTG